MSGKNLWKFGLPVLALMLALPLAGCLRQAQINNLVNLPVVGATGQDLTAAQVKGVILEACRKKEWVAREISPGLISATLMVRRHTAQVEIPYSATSYSINYKTSTNLNYNAKDHSIHNQYNNWVDYLRRDIELGLAKL
jgi:hypothetical protein